MHNQPQYPEYPPQGGYPQQGGYPPQGGYPQQGGYPPPGYQQSTGYPLQQGGGPYGFSQTDDSAILGEPKDDDVDGFGASFSTKAIRHAFIRKVYLILTLQLSATMAVIALFTLHDGVKGFVRSHAYLYYISYAVFLVTYLTLMCCDGVRRKFPLNLVLLVGFTAVFTYMASMISSFYSTHIVLLAVGLTAGITLLLTLFAVQTKYDFTGCGMFLCVASLVVLLFGFVALFISIYTNIKIVQLVYAGLIALLFSMYLVYDTQQIVGGRKHEISAEEHIYGAIVLYMDIMQIFLALLQLVGASNK